MPRKKLFGKALIKTDQHVEAPRHDAACVILVEQEPQESNKDHAFKIVIKDALGLPAP